MLNKQKPQSSGKRVCSSESWLQGPKSTSPIPSFSCPSWRLPLPGCPQRLRNGNRTHSTAFLASRREQCCKLHQRQNKSWAGVGLQCSQTHCGQAGCSQHANPVDNKVGQVESATKVTLACGDWHCLQAHPSEGQVITTQEVPILV